MPEGRLCPGCTATPGGDAAVLHLEISHLGDTPSTLDALYLLPLGNNTTSFLKYVNSGICVSFFIQNDNTLALLVDAMTRVLLRTK